MSEPTASRNALISLVNAEEKQGATISYVQNYRSGGKHVAIQGTLYSGISTFTANKCELKIGTTIVDRYMEQVDEYNAGNTQNIYNYSAVFRLTQEIANSLRLTEARPSTLENGTHPICIENQSCAFQWIEIRANSKVIRLTSTTNDVAGYEGLVTDFDGAADHFWIPVSSLHAGRELVSLLKSFALTCDH